MVSTDHCPFDFHGQKELGRGDFRKIPNGLPGVEDRVDLLHDGGVVGGRISKERWVEVISTGACEDVRHVPAEGRHRRRQRRGHRGLRPEPEADVISAATHHMDVDYSCYEGRQVQGASDVVLSRGSVVVRNGEFTGRKGHGRFVKRAVADYAGWPDAPLDRRSDPRSLPRPGRRPARRARAHAQLVTPTRSATSSPSARRAAASSSTQKVISTTPGR